MKVENLESEREVQSTEAIVTYGGVIDYEENVTNKPKLNGRTIIGDIKEEDPNVQAIDLAELNAIFNSIFN